MKKILVVLLVLAVTTGVFAQGDWSVGASAEIGAFVNLKEDTAVPDWVSTIGHSAWNYTYGGWGLYRGKAEIGYKLGNFNASIGISQADRLGGQVTVEGDTYKFQADSALNMFFNDTNAITIGRLWGHYKPLNGMVHLEVALNSQDTVFWNSDTTGAFGGSINWWGVAGGSNDLFEPGGVFANPDHWNYLLGNLLISGFEIGAMVPNFFNTNGEPGVEPGWDFSATPFVEGSLKKMIIGAKFDMYPIQAAAQFKIENFGIYMGAKFYTGPITVGLSFMGESPDNVSHIKAGLSLDYDGGQFGGGVNAALANYTDTSGDAWGNTMIGIEPGFFINAIPASLCFKLNTGFYFKSSLDKDVPMETSWALQPAIFWSFLGTGAVKGYEWGSWTGMMFRYRIVKDMVNGLDLVFRWGL